MLLKKLVISIVIILARLRNENTIARDLHCHVVIVLPFLNLTAIKLRNLAYNNMTVHELTSTESFSLSYIKQYRKLGELETSLWALACLYLSLSVHSSVFQEKQGSALDPLGGLIATPRPLAVRGNVLQTLHIVPLA